MARSYHRDAIFPEGTLPDAQALKASGRDLARAHGVGDCAFLSAHGVASEAEYKRQRGAQKAVMIHSQIGYRDPEKSRRAWREIHQQAADRDVRVDRYGICLDWSMGYPKAARNRAQRGTGLILDGADAFAELTSGAPVAPHFGDFVLGFPASVENTVAALGAGATAIGNLGQYFTFRLPGHDDDVADTAATLEALSLAAAQPVEILIHSNLDDGFAALFTDLACSLGGVLLEQYIVDELVGGSVSHCYGHSFSEPLKRLAFQLALAEVSANPGTMVYGNTVSYAGSGSDNYAALAAYLSVDIAAQLREPSGHAVNPVPITEAARIPDIDEVVDAAVFAGRAIQLAQENEGAFAFEEARALAAPIVAGAQTFKASVLKALDAGGVDIANPFEMLLALRRIGARRLEEDFGPGARADDAARRTPVVAASTIAALGRAADKAVARCGEGEREGIRRARLRVCVGASDVHEYGKILLIEVLRRLDVEILDCGVHADPALIARRGAAEGADAVAISTYNGVALDYLGAVQAALAAEGLDVPVLIGGKTNQIPKGSNTSLPVDVSTELEAAGARVCRTIDDLAPALAAIARRSAAVSAG
ncbi:MAG: hypothetical protein AcusKO_08560 [Acuticoccus sp.]